MASSVWHLKSINLESNQDGNIDCPLLSPRPYNPYILIYLLKRLWPRWWWWYCCGVAVAMVMLMMIALVTSTYFYDKRWWWFPPGFVKISLKDFYRLPDFIFAFCNLCIVRFRFPPSSTPAVKYRRYQIQIQKQIVQFRSPRTFSSPSGSLSNKKR